MGYIYGIRNKINNKWYIGQSKRYPICRWKQHIAGYHDMIISRAIAKYGAEQFDFLILEEVNDELLDEKEIYYIDKYESYLNGYNGTRGGHGDEEGYRIKVKYSEVVQYYHDNPHLSCRKIAKHFNIDKDTVAIILRTNGIRTARNVPITITDTRKDEAYEFNTVVEAAKFIEEENKGVEGYTHKWNTIRKIISKSNSYKDYIIVREV